MITNLRLANFRLFNREVNIRIRPITILIGRNSAGKSSVIKFLSMLKQSLDRDTSDFFDADGEATRFGSFKNLKNSVSQKQYMFFDLDVSSSSIFQSKNLDPAASTLRENLEEKAALFNISGRIAYGKYATQSYQALKIRLLERSEEPYMSIIERPLSENDSFLQFTTELQRLFKKFQGKPEPSSGNSSDIADAGMKDMLFVQHLQHIRSDIGFLKHLGLCARSLVVLLKPLIPQEIMWDIRGSTPYSTWKACLIATAKKKRKRFWINISFLLLA